jgi:putative colanic acid biosysnthesis UDP-glucose lipid carrier transferase
MSHPPIRPARSVVPLLLYVLDSCVVLGLFQLVQTLCHANGTSANGGTIDGAPISWTMSLLAALFLNVSGEIFSIFRSSHGRSADIEVILITSAWTTAFAGSLLIANVLEPLHPASSTRLALWFLVCGLSLLLNHMVVRGFFEWLTETGLFARRTAIVGYNEVGLQIAFDASNDRDGGMKIVGVFDDGTSPQNPPPRAETTPLAGDVDALLHAIRDRRIDTVLIALPMHAEQRVQRVLDQLADTTASVYIIPNFSAFEFLHSRWAHVGGHTVLSVFETPIYGVDGMLKRWVDVLLSLLGLLLAAPIMLVCGMMIALTSRGPIFFLQRRYGLDGKEFSVWKFRTMVTCDNGPVVKQAVKNDPRVTPVGRLLRRTSLDELPQLFNVLAGSMSLVGPRPYACAHNEQFRSLIRGYMLRHKVKPGITGLAQVLESRLETDTVDKMIARIQLDHRYIREWSLWLDIKILFKTIGVVLRQEAN